MADPYKDKVVLFLPMEGSHDGSTVFNDRTGKTVTRNGDTNLSTTVTPPWGKTSAYFDGTGDYLSVADSPDFNFAGNFTIEGWFYATTIGNYPCIVTRQGSAGYLALQVRLAETTKKLEVLAGIQPSVTTITGTTTVTENAWHHFAVSRDGTTLRTFLNGSIEGSATVSTDLSGAHQLIIGGLYPTGGSFQQPFSGYIKDLRITKGVARYTGNFSVSQNTKLDDQYWNKTALAIHGEGTGTTFTDASNNNFTVTTNGNATHSTAVAPPFGTSSIYFDGSGDYLSTSSNSIWQFGTGDFTVEAWVYIDPTGPNYQHIWTIGSQTSGDTFKFANTGNYAYYISHLGTTTPCTTSNNSVIFNTWHHIAYVRRNGIFYIFINGVLAGYNASYTGTSIGITSTTTVGYGHTGEYFKGYIKDLRVTKGIARYTQNFNPWKVQDQYYKDSVLLISGEGSGTTFTDGSFNSKTITTSGNTTHSTAVNPPFGTSSIYFDGTGDYLSLADSTDFQFGSGDFTIEAWVRFAALPAASNAMAFAARQNSGGSNRSWILNVWNAAGQYQLNLNTSNNGSATTGTASGNVSLATGVWYHVAGVRRGNVLMTFLDGAAVGSGTETGSLYVGSVAVNVGRTADGAYYLNGYIKDLRIIKGVAKYTSDFTPVKSPAQTKSNGIPVTFPDKTGIKTIVKPLQWNEPEQDRVMI